MCGVSVCTFKNASVCTFKTSPCVPTPRPHVVTHAGVVPVHTGTLSIHTRRFFGRTHGGEGGEERERGEGSPSVLLTKKSPRRVLTWPHKFTERNPWILPIRSLRIDREQLVPESSNHSLYLMNLFIFSNLEESAHTTDTNTNTTHTHAPTHTHQPTDPPNITPLPSLPSPSPSPSHTQTHMYMHVYLCMCVYAYVDV